MGCDYIKMPIHIIENIGTLECVNINTVTYSFIINLLGNKMPKLATLIFTGCTLYKLPPLKNLKTLKFTNTLLYGYESCPIYQFPELNHFTIDYYTISKDDLVDLNYEDDGLLCVISSLYDLVSSGRMITIVIDPNGWVGCYYMSVLRFLGFAIKNKNVRLTIDCRFILNFLDKQSTISEQKLLSGINWNASNVSLTDVYGLRQLLEKKLNSDGTLKFIPK
jgi:hypothetical protein